jgi:hypothetical protein
METTLGQFASTSCITLFRICPLFKGKHTFNFLWAVSNEHCSGLPLCLKHCAWCSVPRHVEGIPSAEFWSSCHVIPARRGTFHIPIVMGVLGHKVSMEFNCTGGTLTWLPRFPNQGRLVYKGCNLQNLTNQPPLPWNHTTWFLLLVIHKMMLYLIKVFYLPTDALFISLRKHYNLH